MEPKTFEREIAGRKLRVEFGRVAGQANGAALVSYGETTLLTTATMAPHTRAGIDFFPLTVEFDERFYAAGRIKGSRWIKREGRATDEAVLSGRLIDHAIRPLFPQRFRNEVQVVITVFSFDQENDPDVLGLVGSSFALMSSDIPWSGPLAAVRIAGTDDGKLTINPTYAERAEAHFEMVVSGPRGLANMIEVAGGEVTEDILIRAFAEARKGCDSIIDFMEEIGSTLPYPTKRNDLISRANEELKRKVHELAANKLRELLRAPRISKSAWRAALHDLKEQTLETIRQEVSAPGANEEADEAFEDVLAQELRSQVLADGIRPDGRALDEIRPMQLSAGVLPRVHGSGLFERGETQALSVLTLGAPGMEQYLETMELVGRKHFMHHYNFPPFSTGEVKSMRGPGRREIGHGALVERALEPVLPPKKTFPYTIRVVSEILSSNGSTSMAAATASSLALMDGGVAIERPVAGISIGMISNSGDEWKLLTDIQGPEDHHGDMDFKVAGTQKGVTAIQMDIKIPGINGEQFRRALEAGKKARLEILELMRGAIPVSRPSLSPYAPRIIVLKIKPERIKDVIGPGGSMIHRISAESGAAIEVEDSGEVFITAPTLAEAEKAKKWIEGLTHEYELGEVAQGKVVKLLDFGAVVELPGGKEGLLHISELAPWRVEKVEDVVQLGQEFPVKIVRAENGKLGVSIKALKYPELARETQPRARRMGARRRMGERKPFRTGSFQSRR